MAINWQALKQHRSAAPWLALDMLMMCLIAVDLLWLLVDAVLFNSGIGVLLSRHMPALLHHYRQHWQDDARVYDSLLTGILLLELALRWGLAIVQRTYHRWFFYPFIHWYDVLGCLPGLQPLRLLRLVALFYHLSQLGILSIGQGLIATAQKYYNIVLEEISDRIVINVLNGVQQEIRSGNQVTGQLRDRVLTPQKAVIVSWLARRLSILTAQARRQHEQALADYLQTVVADAVHDNPEWRSLKRLLPLVGNRMEQQINALAGSLVADIAQRVLADLSRPDNQAIHDLADSAFDTFTLADEEMSRAIEQIALEALDLIKAQVAVQQWKIAEAAEKS